MILSAIPSFLSLLLFLSTAYADKYYQLKLGTAQVQPDGFPRIGITFDGAFNAPLLTAQKNEKISVNVTNNIKSPAIRQSATVHWHGIAQHRTASEDGVALVSQCPISSGMSYNYEFSTGSQAGTFWYHSHHSTQYCDGLRGPLVIYDPQDPLRELYDVDDETTVVSLADWNHKPSMAAFSDPTIISPTPDSILINNVGRYVGGPANPPHIFSVQSHKRYRFRLINMACLTNLNITIDGHTFTVIEADGVLHRPLRVDSLLIYPGQRYSIIVNANQPVGNYWFRATPVPLVNNGTNSTDPALYNAILRYHGAPNRIPTTKASRSLHPLSQNDLVPLINPGPPGGSGPADVSINLLIGLNLPNWTLNGVSFFPPSVPVLLQILSGASAAQDLLPKGDVYTLPPNKVIELTITDTVTVDPVLAHPFHLHGHSFDIVKGGAQVTPNYVNPPRRDVVPVYDGNVTIRFKTDNPGPWILHCHIDWHLNQGMAVVLAEDPAGIRQGSNSVIVPQEWDELCTAYDALPPSAQ